MLGMSGQAEVATSGQPSRAGAAITHGGMPGSHKPGAEASHARVVACLFPKAGRDACQLVSPTTQQVPAGRRLLANVPAKCCRGREEGSPKSDSFIVVGNGHTQAELNA